MTDKAHQTDPAIERAQELWHGGQHKEAVGVLVRRIKELNAEARARSEYRRLWPSGLVIITLGVLLGIVAGIVLVTQVDIFKENYDPAVQEWWSYNAPAVDEFISSLNLAMVFLAMDATDEYDYSDSVSRYMEQARDYRQQFETAEYPYKAKPARDNILYGMIDYSLFVRHIEDEILETNEFSGDTMQYLEDGRARMREAAEQLEKLTGEDAGWLILEDTQAP